jgi:hypothetical protein
MDNNKVEQYCGFWFCYTVLCIYIEEAVLLVSGGFQEAVFACAFAATALTSSSVFNVICRAWIVPSGGVISSFNKSYISRCRAGNFYSLAPCLLPQTASFVPSPQKRMKRPLSYSKYLGKRVLRGKGASTGSVSRGLCCLAWRRGGDGEQSHCGFRDGRDWMLK